MNRSPTTPTWAISTQICAVGPFTCRSSFWDTAPVSIFELSNAPQSAILDRAIYEDAYIFARALHHLGNLSERDYLSYRRVFDLVVSRLPPPDLLIYLNAPVEVLVRRIRRRGREMESGIDADYLALLNTFYDEWLNTYDTCPVLTIRSDDLDFVHQPEHLDIVVDRIQDRLAGKEECWSFRERACTTENTEHTEKTLYKDLLLVVSHSE